jgi:hypothetical protein
MKSLITPPMDLEYVFHAYPDHVLFTDDDGGGIFANDMGPEDAEYTAAALNAYARLPAIEAEMAELKAAAQERQSRHVDNQDLWLALARKLIAERDAARSEVKALKAELVALKRKTTPADALQRAIIETLRTLESAWPAREVPSSRLWAAIIDRGAVAVERPGMAQAQEPHRYYRAKEALIRDGRISEKLGFVRLAEPVAEPAPTFDVKTPEPEYVPTFAD